MLLCYRFFHWQTNYLRCIYLILSVVWKIALYVLSAFIALIICMGALLIYYRQALNRINRSHSYSRYWTGSSLQVRLMKRVFSNANDINPQLNDIPPRKPPLHASSSPVPAYYSLTRLHATRLFIKSMKRSLYVEKLKSFPVLNK